MRKHESTGRRMLAALVVGAMLLVSCGGDSEGRGAPDEGKTSNGGQEVPAGEVGFVDRDTDSEGEPVEGGTLIVAPYVFAAALDPARLTDSGVGNSELALFFDALVRYDHETGEYAPWLAESFESDDEYLTWTVKLREGVTFSDGTPLDSEAVKLHMERTQEHRPRIYVEGITVETPDPLTVVFNLPEPWAGFPYALSANPGRIVSPAAVEEYGDDIVANPVGTGPFVLKSWEPGEELVAERNPDYWDGTPHLDAVKYVNIKGDQARAESIKAGDADLSYLRDPIVVDEMRDAGFRGFLNVYGGGEVLIINNGVHSDETPGADERVRQAIAMAIDIDLLRDDLGNGKGLWTKQFLGLMPQLDTTVDGVGYDPDAAAALVEEAKADGYDGKIELTCNATPERERTATAVQAQLNAVGFDVSIDRVPSQADTIKKYQQDGTFELACYGFSFQGQMPFAELSNVLRPGNTLGYEDSEIEDILLEFRQAGTREEMSAAADRLQERMNETQPLLPLSSTQEFVPWSDRVHGMDVTSFGQPIYSDVWLAK